MYLLGADMSDEKLFMARLPAELRPEIEKLAKGSGAYPPTSVAAAIEFLVRIGLDTWRRQQAQQTSPSQEAR
jgi:hypothetical protein